MKYQIIDTENGICGYEFYEDYDEAYAEWKFWSENGKNKNVSIKEIDNKKRKSL